MSYRHKEPDPCPWYMPRTFWVWMHRDYIRLELELLRAESMGIRFYAESLLERVSKACPLVDVSGATPTVVRGMCLLHGASGLSDWSHNAILGMSRRLYMRGASIEHDLPRACRPLAYMAANIKHPVVVKRGDLLPLVELFPGFLRELGKLHGEDVTCEEVLKWAVAWDPLHELLSP